MTGNQRINPDELPPMQHLICELLAARHRNGFAWWPIQHRFRPTLAELTDAGLVNTDSGPEGADNAKLTDLGRQLFMPVDWTPPAAGDLAALLRFAAQGRREYAASAPRAARALIEIEAGTLESAAQVAEGQVRPLIAWIPSWRITPAMHDYLYRGVNVPVADMLPPAEKPSRCLCLCAMTHPRAAGVCGGAPAVYVVATNRAVDRTPMCQPCADIAAGQPSFVRTEPLAGEDPS